MDCLKRDVGVLIFIIIQSALIIGYTKIMQKLIVHTLLSLFLLTQVALAKGVMVMKLIPLKYHDADHIKSLITPMLAPQGKISGRGYTLVINTTRENMTELRSLIRKIDVKPKSLRIRVRVGGGGQTKVNRFSQSYHTHRFANEKVVQILEGRGAYIMVGGDRPYVSVINGPFLPQVLISYRRMRQGFWVVAYIRDGKALLKIIQRQDGVSPETLLALEKLATTVIVPLGEWTTLGGGEVEEKDSKWRHSYRSRNTQAMKQISIMVNVIKR